MSMIVEGCTGRGSGEVVRVGKGGLLEEVMDGAQAIFAYVGCEENIGWRRGGAVRVEADSRTWLVGSSVMVQGARGLSESVVSTGSSLVELVDVI